MICLLAVVAVGGIGTVATLVKSVVLVVDGKPMALRSFAGSVQELLGEAGVSVGYGDSVRPAGQVELADGTRIVVRHARPITLTLDGHTTRRLVTATNVGDALAELDISPAGGRLSAPPTKHVPLSGMSLSVYTRREVYVETGGVRMAITTTGRTVREVLRQRRIPLRPGYRVRPPLDSFPAQGTVIRVSPPEPPHTVAVPAAVAALDWAALAHCMSNGDPLAVNPAGPYYGMYGFSVAMWTAVGGTGLPHAWPPEEQTYRAQLLYQLVGGRWQGQWRECGARLFD
ncbi:resuscitation-promoting factor [Nonomuraea aurantiaca]|uniref:resuscitation-promoting factor n=1 Tax=Nonomuraea aurantiaca TaxID=2878562 RepID=UPI001CDA5519|nr:resuscitation-promoting factor [Nonomuraea aurantiaca]MCA2225723.1 ubiquitin-like domain-containing protein [Nonomuraea aurantiaca]